MKAKDRDKIFNLLFCLFLSYMFYTVWRDDGFIRMMIVVVAGMAIFIFLYVGVEVMVDRTMRKRKGNDV